ncbi:MAG: HAD-IG family 5'-nucleotidase, partial [Myxococcaceae bacterium]|nr:HAD-IG family 5'-nucleotidase [Myxococcaceae bacterium]
MLEPLHGSQVGPIDRAHTVEALRRARGVLEDPGLRGLLAHPGGDAVERSRAIYVNRNLRMSNVSMVGFDMDYTLAIYHQRRIEQLSFDLTVKKLIEAFGYPKEIEAVRYDGAFVMRGLFVDKRHGNLIKMDRFGHVGRAYHGRTLLSDEELARLYRNERIRLKNPEYAWIDTLFALPEACLFADTIALLEVKLGRTLDYGKLYDDIREAIDTVHRDNSLKQIIRADIGRYIFKDPELGPALHKLRSGGKRLFVLTNSL